ncbi:hypothetical protein BX666DRAFT_1984491 [Dichotomocladium elegans]|nr:hypothetical protein BX666DRAFT_1984491 [Dichotomocladium elegans]
MGINDALRDQSSKDAVLTVKSLGIQLLVNASVSLGLLLCISWLRPLHYLAYPPSEAPLAGGHKKATHEFGWIDWIKQLTRVSDDFLIDRIGFDAVLFLRFVRMIRNLLAIMTLIGAGILMPINVIATQRTGDWPPVAWDLGLLSISSINLFAGKVSTTNDDRWYWAPILATWLFTVLLLIFLHRSSNDYLQMRRQFYKTPAYTLSSRSLLLTNIPKYIQSNHDLKKWISTTCGIHLPVQQVYLGRSDSKLISLIELYKEAVENLEDAIAIYARDRSGRRPVIWMAKSWLPKFTRKEPIDAIEHYTKRVSDLYQAIKQIPAKDQVATDYGWVTFSCAAWANSALQIFKKRNLNALAHISPPANDLIWPNMSISKRSRTARLWIGRVYFTIFLFTWSVPVAALSIISSIVNMIRLYPESRDYIEKYWFILGLVQAYIAPCVTAILFFALPRFFLRLVKKQGYLTRSMSDRKVLVMLNLFFISNHLILFTICSVFIGIVGQLRELVLYGDLEDGRITEYTAQLAKNIADFSSFWINLVCVRAVGVSLEVVQVIPVITIRLRTLFMRPSPRRLKRLLAPPHFEFAQNYNIVIFFFTIALIYATTSPLVLPFSLIYFSAASYVYKYILMYIYVTKVESGGGIWPVVFRSTVISMVLAQFGSFVLILLKGGHIQAYTLLPLILLTILFLIIYSRRLHRLATSVAASMVTHEDPATINTTSTLENQYRDPLLNATYLMPLIHSDMRSLLSQIYPGYEQQKQKQKQKQQQNQPQPSQPSMRLVSNASDCIGDITAQETVYPSVLSTDIPRIQPRLDEEQITLYNPIDNRSVIFQAVSDKYFSPQKCYHCCSCDDPDHSREPSAPSLHAILASAPSTSVNEKSEVILQNSTEPEQEQEQEREYQHQQPAIMVHERLWEHRVVTAEQHQHPAPSLSPAIELPTYTAALHDRSVTFFASPLPATQTVPRLQRRHSDPVIKYNNDRISGGNI